MNTLHNYTPDVQRVTHVYIKCTVIFVHFRKLFNQLLFRKSALRRLWNVTETLSLSPVRKSKLVINFWNRAAHPQPTHCVRTTSDKEWREKPAGRSCAAEALVTSSWLFYIAVHKFGSLTHCVRTTSDKEWREKPAGRSCAAEALVTSSWLFYIAVHKFGSLTSIIKCSRLIAKLASYLMTSS